jgi:hypothetical protein
VSLADLFSIYNCPATNITAANAIANIALANCGTSFILCFRRMSEADVGPQSADTIKLNFRFPSGQDRQTGEAMGIHPDDER